MATLKVRVGGAWVVPDSVRIWNGSAWEVVWVPGGAVFPFKFHVRVGGEWVNVT